MRRARRSADERRRELQARLADKGLAGLFEDIADTLRRALPDSSQRTGSSGISFRLPAGGRRRRFCHLWIWGVGAQVEWFARPENYSMAALEALGQEAERCGWLPATGGYSLDIADDQRWTEVREGLIHLVTIALHAWNPAPPSGTGNFHERVWSYVRDVPRGRVVTYGQVAEGLGSPEAAQAVGNAMRALPDETDVPWHRVVTAQGRLAANEPQEHRRRLGEEGVSVGEDDSVDLEERQWRG